MKTILLIQLLDLAYFEIEKSEISISEFYKVFDKTNALRRCFSL